MATLSLRRLWTIYNRTAVESGASKRELLRTQLAFYSGARGVLKVLAHLMERGEYEELHATLKREAGQIDKIWSRGPRAKSH